MKAWFASIAVGVVVAGAVYWVLSHLRSGRSSSFELHI